MTFSLVGRCAERGTLGVAISSSSPAVAARCAFVRAGAGAATSQNLTDPRLGPRLLDELAGGATAPAAIGRVATASPEMDHRQLAVVDARGGTSAFSGPRSLGRFGHVEADACVAAGNLLADAAVLDAMVASFADGAGAHLAERLLAGLEAGLRAGGEEGPVRSAGLVVADDVPWPTVDLRVDWHDEPIAELRRLWELWRPQEREYVTRALHPDAAPSFGVPGDR